MLKSRELLSYNLNRISEKRKVTQKDIADATKLDVGTVNRIFKGRQGIRDGNLEIIAETLNCHISDLYAEPPSRYAIPDFSSAASFLSKIGTLSPDRQKVILGLVHDDPAFVSGDPDLFPPFEALLKVL